MLGNFSNFVELLETRAQQQPHKVAFSFLQDGETVLASVTYQELDQQARAIAALLQSYNAQGERALLLYQPGLEFIAAFLGCLYAGVIAVPAYPPRQNRSLDRLQAIVDDAQAKFALTTESVVKNIETRFEESKHQDLHCLATDNLSPSIITDYRNPNITASQLGFLQYTSGSTGLPKGVMVSHGNLIHNSYLINQCFQDTADSHGVSWLPPYHDMGLIGGILQPLYVGASMCLLAPVAFLQRPYFWLEAITKYRATTSGGPNFAYDLCVTQITEKQKANLDLSCWELAFTGAEPVRADTIERFAQAFADCGFQREAFYPCYGMAETTLIVSGGQKSALPIVKNVDKQKLAHNQVKSVISTPLNDQEQEGTILESNFEITTLVSSGQAISDQKILIVNPETLNICKEDEIGEIWVQGDSVAQGYWNRSELTQEIFAAEIKDHPDQKWLRTGDLGFLEQNELFVTGRLKDLIIIRGRNYYPQDIELTVDQAHPAIREACGAAFAVDVDGEERLVIVQEVKRSYLRKLNLEEVGTNVQKAIGKEHELQVYSILFLKTGTIPKTSSGKIRRHACKEGFIEDTLDIVGKWENHQLSVTSNQLSVKLTDQKDVYHRIELNLSEISKQQQVIQDWLVEKIADKLGILASNIDINESFASYGLDSVQAVRLTADLEDWLECKLEPTLAYDFPNIANLSAYLAQNKLNKVSKELVSSSISHSPFPIPHSPFPIAIVGIGCRFPGANNPEQFWYNLQQGKDSITSVTRWQGDSYGGFLDNIDQFDANFFGISPREAQKIDPQQRLLLEVSWEALEDAGIAPDELAGSNTGVFIGISSNDYSQLQIRDNITVDAYSGTGNAHSIAANRLSYSLDLRGPSLSIDTACSSSLVAVHLACQSLQRGECSHAIAGGVNLLLSPELTETFTIAGMMSRDGRCKTFDASADGYVRGEGCGVVILKSLDQALTDGNQILALIYGSAINQDGKSNGLTAPNGRAQQAVIAQALANAGLTPEKLSYIEAHGTGTALGDPIEVNAIKQVVGETGRQGDKETRGQGDNESKIQNLKSKIQIGSVKTNIGHLEAAAGIAGLIKVVLALKNQEIPSHLHFREINPHIDLGESLAIPTTNQPWKASDKPRYAGVSSFGFGGTNAHLIIGDAQISPKDVVKNNFERYFNIATLSAKSNEALKDLVRSYDQYLTKHESLSIANLAYTSNVARSHFKHRLAIIAESQKQLKEDLEAYLQGETPVNMITAEANPNLQTKTAFLFTGQGSQYVGMGYQLYQTEPLFRQILDECDAILHNYLDISILEIIYPSLNSERSYPSKNSELRTPNSELTKTVYTQPALFIIEYALAKLWLSWGIQPNIVMGHSVGEYVAACLAGVFSLEDGLKLIAARGRLMQSLPENGSMVAIFASETQVKDIITPYQHQQQNQIAIAAYNGSHIVISGENKAINQVIEQFKEQGIQTKNLKVSYAFHSPLMQPMLADFRKIAQEITYNQPQLPIVSNVTGKLATTEIATTDYWVNHIMQPVKFAQSIQVLEQEKINIFLEIGAKPTLIGIIKALLSKNNHNHELLTTNHELFIPSLRPKQEDVRSLLNSLATLYTQGIKIEWRGFNQNYPYQLISLPTYPFQRQRYWYKEDNLITPIQAKTRDDWFYQVTWELKAKEINNISTKAQTWLILVNEHDLAFELVRELTQKGDSCFFVYPGQIYQQLNPTSWQLNPEKPEDWELLLKEVNNQTSLTGIIHLWSLDTDDTSVGTFHETSLQESSKSNNVDNKESFKIEKAQIKGCASILLILQTLIKHSLSPKLWIITQNTQTITPPSPPPTPLPPLSLNSLGFRKGDCNRKS